MTRGAGATLVPLDEAGAEAIGRVAHGEEVWCKIVRKRNPAFHRKFFALIDLLYGIWSETVPQKTYRGVEVRPNRDRFRRDLIILTGRYDATYSAVGEVRLEAHSISFARMSEDEFEVLFSDVIQVGLTRILSGNRWTEEAIRHHVDQILAFD
jgi:hypothetical protein